MQAGWGERVGGDFTSINRPLWWRLTHPALSTKLSSIVFQGMSRVDLLRYRTVPRYTISISIKPAIAVPEYPIEAWQVENSIERPCPPNLPGHIEVCVGSR